EPAMNLLLDLPGNGEPEQVAPDPLRRLDPLEPPPLGPQGGGIQPFERTQPGRDAGRVRPRTTELRRRAGPRLTGPGRSATGAHVLSPPLAEGSRSAAWPASGGCPPSGDGDSAAAGRADRRPISSRISVSLRNRRRR